MVELQLPAPRRADISDIHVMPTRQLRDLPRDPPGAEAGIYFLWHDDALIYIGQSICIANRLRAHERARDGISGGREIPFSWHTCFIWEESKYWREKVEYLYIRTYRPPYNAKVLG